MTVRNFIKQTIRRVTGTQIIIQQLDALKGDIDAAAERLAAAPPTAAAPEAPATPAPTDVRQKVAYEYLKPGSSGIEIGAFASPLAVPPGVHVAYLDRHDPREIQAEFNIAGLTPKDFGFDSAALIVPDILDDGQALAKVGDLSQDFVIANHVLEHFENPVKGFKNMLRVLKHGGVLYLALPEMQHSFDRIRRPTPFEHVWRDYEEGPAWSRRQAFEEFAEVFVENGMDKNLFPQSWATRAPNSPAAWRTTWSGRISASTFTPGACRTCWRCSCNCTTGFTSAFASSWRRPTATR